MTVWKPLKIGGGGFCSGMDIAPDGTIVVRIDVFGAYLLDPGGSTWRQLVTETSLPAADSVATDPYFGRGVYEIRIAPSDSNRLYMLRRTTDALGYVYKSIDRGVTWTRTAFTPVAGTDPNDTSFKSYGQKMAVDPANADVVYVGTPRNGLWVTFNAGSSWAQISTASVPVSTTDAGVCAIAFDPTSGTTGGKTNTIYASSGGNGVYQSTDAGASWGLLSSGPTNGARNGKVSSAGVYYACSLAATQIFKYSGGWTDITPADAASAVITVAVDPFDATRVVSDKFSARLSVSTNSGGTWGTRSGAPVTGSSDVPWLQSAQDPSLGESQIEFDPLVQNRLWLAGGTGVFYTTIPAGPLSTPTWHGLTAGQESLVANCIIAPLNGYPICGSWDRPTFTITDPDSYPSNYGPNYTFEIVACWSLDWASSDPSFIVALNNFGFSGDVGQSSHSTDKGLTWTKFTTQPFSATVVGRGGCIAASTIDNFVAVSSNDGFPFRTANKGVSWSAITIAGVPTSGDAGWAHNGFQQRQMVAADRVTASKFYMYNFGNISNTGDAWAGVYTSVDNGVNWTRTFSDHVIAFPYDANSLKMRTVPGYAGHLFICSGPLGSPGDSHPYDAPPKYSSDGGVTWTSVANIKEVFDFGFGAAAPGSDYPTVFFVGWLSNVYGIYRSVSTASQWAAGTQTWENIGTHPLDSDDRVTCISGDMSSYVNVYLGYEGSGYAYFSDSAAQSNIFAGAQNTQTQFGFRHIGYMPGATSDYQLNVRAIQSSYTTAIYYGDPVVKLAATQYIAPASGNQTTIMGVFQGCMYWPKVGSMPVWSRFWPGGPQRTDATAYIVDAPTALFMSASLLTAVPSSAIGQNIGFALGATPSTTGPGYSTYVVDQSALTTSSQAPFQVYGMYQGAGNGSDHASNYNWVVVCFNNERFKAQTGNA